MAANVPSSLAISALSSSLRAKSKTFKFSTMHSGLMDFTNTIMSRSTSQRVITCATDLPYFAPILLNTGLWKISFCLRQTAPTLPRRCLRSATRQRLRFLLEWIDFNLISLRHHFIKQPQIHRAHGRKFLSF